MLPAMCELRLDLQKTICLRKISILYRLNESHGARISTATIAVTISKNQIEN